MALGSLSLTFSNRVRVQRVLPNEYKGAGVPSAWVSLPKLTGKISGSGVFGTGFRHPRFGRIPSSACRPYSGLSQYLK